MKKTYLLIFLFQYVNSANYIVINEPTQITTTKVTVENARPEIKGSTNPGNVVKIILDQNRTFKATVFESGDWKVLLPLINIGDHTIKAIATDPNGSNKTTLDQTYNINTTNFITVNFASADNIVRNLKPQIKGTTRPNSDITISIERKLAGETKADSNGDWSFKVPFNLREGQHLLTVESNDPSNNTAKYETTFVIDISTYIIINSPSSNQVLVNPQPLISGITQKKNNLVNVFIDDKKVGEANINQETGNWTFKISKPLSNGRHKLRVLATRTSQQTTIKPAVATASLFFNVNDDINNSLLTLKIFQKYGC